MLSEVPSKPWGIVTALSEETDAILKGARDVERIALSGARAFGARFGAENVGAVLVETGTGPKRAARGIEAMLGRFDVVRLLGAGVAGALSPNLLVGDLVFGQALCDEDGKAPSPSRPGEMETLLGPLGGRGAVLATCSRIAITAREKAGLLADARDTCAGANCDCVAVDMESAAWARVAARQGVSFDVIRAISDTAEEDLPDFLAGCLDADGGVDRARVVGAALLRPWRAGDLLKMKTRVTTAVGRLASAIERVIAAR